jgi:heterodisulfide reductase subunit A-like polyferredoxin
LTSYFNDQNITAWSKQLLEMGNNLTPSPQVQKKDSSILIIGGGTWGISIAYRLARRGYTNITVLDPNDILSSVAAGNDLNKILEERE